jgi:hypothetical protein
VLATGLSKPHSLVCFSATRNSFERDTSRWRSGFAEANAATAAPVANAGSRIATLTRRRSTWSASFSAPSQPVGAGDGELVAVALVEVVGRHQQSAIRSAQRSASAAESGDGAHCGRLGRFARSTVVPRGKTACLNGWPIADGGLEVRTRSAPRDEAADSRWLWCAGSSPSRRQVLSSTYRRR